jgi:hypothetical protein
VAQGEGPEFKPQYKKKKVLRPHLSKTKLGAAVHVQPSDSWEAHKKKDHSSLQPGQNKTKLRAYLQNNQWRKDWSCGRVPG